MAILNSSVSPSSGTISFHRTGNLGYNHWGGRPRREGVVVSGSGPTIPRSPASEIVGVAPEVRGRPELELLRTWLICATVADVEMVCG